MSQSFAHDGGAEQDRDAPSAESLDEQLAAEFADHLSAATDEFVRGGKSADEAAQLALQRFGDVAKVKWSCWWIHNGEEVMFRTAGIALLSLLTIGVAVVGFGGWQLQRNLASRTEELSAQLESLSSTQQAMLAQQRPPEITGLAYLGDPSNPAKDVEIKVFRFSEEPPPSLGFTPSGVVTRRLRTDALGRFDSGILQAGEYCVLAPLLDPEGKTDKQGSIFTQLQSRPLYLTAGIGKSKVDLDLAASARIRLEVTNIPNSIRIADEEVSVTVQVLPSTEEARYFERQPVPPSDEPPRDGWPLPLPGAPSVVGFGQKRPADLPSAWWLPPRSYSVMVQLSFQPKQGVVVLPSQTRSMPFDLKLTPGNTATLTLSVPGEPLENRFAAAVEDFEKKNQRKLEPGPDMTLILKSVADGAELKVAVAMQEAAHAP